ncbi:MAG TPA: hypothetical protein VFE25_08440 [Opitutaceae bacterium]|nr:hypothetical protein [Opitutaceae bacterium]
MASALQAMSVVAPTFSKLVDHATQILRVEVTASSSRWDSTSSGKVIDTYVQCSIERTLKGATASSITLRFLGGSVGDDHMEAPGMPVLQVGQSYVLFIAKNGDAFCPIVAGAHGSYPISLDASTKAQTVLRANLQPLVSISAVSDPMQGSAASLGQAAVGPGLSLAAFEDSILSEVTRESAH